MHTQHFIVLHGNNDPFKSWIHVGRDSEICSKRDYIVLDNNDVCAIRQKLLWLVQQHISSIICQLVWQNLGFLLEGTRAFEQMNMLLCISLMGASMKQENTDPRNNKSSLLYLFKYIYICAATFESDTHITMVSLCHIVNRVCVVSPTVCPSNSQTRISAPISPKSSGWNKSHAHPTTSSTRA